MISISFSNRAVIVMFLYSVIFASAVPLPKPGKTTFEVDPTKSTKAGTINKSRQPILVAPPATIDTTYFWHEPGDGMEPSFTPRSKGGNTPPKRVRKKPTPAAKGSRRISLDKPDK
ncbi:hypothetical protein CROQUDRAFT_652201 [Cronartium quercuum f. sp. fusiforme G11]|uniref:Secreted protein n=1 Tax=Cronartium quercuum f. sp. fusiforme G11 TaxID=708437 RepID=A0A9P6NUU2_9BASI|nr:hypothetical protein CROQUDRAFT_652201 [Cronartium quercuum f. sp. fusiforme G11]